MSEPKTMRRPRRRVVETDDEATLDSSVDEAVQDAPDGDDDGDPTEAMSLHGGWTDGQKVMDSTSTFAQAFKPEASMQIIKFLDEKPYANYRRHWVDRIGAQGPYKRPYTCLESVGKDCPLCNIGDRPQAVSSFNVVVLGDEGELTLRSWDLGAKLFNVVKAYHADPKTGPLPKRFYGVNKTGSGGKGSGGTTQTNVNPIGAASLREDYSMEPPSDEDLEQAAKKAYNADIVDIPKRKDLEEIAQEIADLD